MKHSYGKVPIRGYLSQSTLERVGHITNPCSTRDPLILNDIDALTSPIPVDAACAERLVFQREYLQLSLNS